MTAAGVLGQVAAANIWMTSAIGIAGGLGRESIAVLSTLPALAVLQLVPRLLDRRR